MALSQEFNLTIGSKKGSSCLRIEPAPDPKIMQFIDMKLILRRAHYDKSYRQHFIALDDGPQISEICTDKPDKIVEMGRLVTQALISIGGNAHFDEEPKYFTDHYSDASTP